MTSRAPVLCRACARFIERDGSCSAFPEGIPSEIVVFAGDHRTPVEGDNGILFLQGQTPEQIEAFNNWEALQEAG